MQTGPFFYSTNGTDVHGPVVDQDLRLLVLDERIGRGSFLCRAGDNTWVPFNPDAFRPAVAPVRTTRIVPAQMYAKLWSPPGEIAAPPSAAPAPTPAPPRPVVESSPALDGAKPPRLPDKAADNSAGPALAPGRVASVSTEPVSAKSSEPARPPTLKTPPPDARPGGASVAPAALFKTPRVAVNLAAPGGSPKTSGPSPIALIPPQLKANPPAAQSDRTSEPALARPTPVPPPLAAEVMPPATAAALPDAPDEPEADSPGDSRAFAVAFGFIGILAAVGAALLSAFLAATGAGGPRRVFILALAALILVPSLGAFLAPARGRGVVRAGGMVLLALALCLYQLTRPGVNDAVQLAFSQQAPPATLPALPASPVAAANAHSPARDVVPGADRDLSAVTSALLARIKASTDVERACKFTLENVRGTDDLAERHASFLELRAAQGEVVGYLQDYDRHCREALAAEGIAPAEANPRVAAARKTAHVESNLEIWKARVKLTADNIARFDYLRQDWGHWEYRNGEVVLDDAAKAADYGKLVDAVKVDIAQIRLAQAQVYR